jgi:glyoxylase-like metal-dependent hydrolase (beta-lactamase superfamily II)
MGQLLEAAALPRTTIPTAVNAFLVNTGERLVLIDAGTATAMGPSLGRLLINLAAAGIEPAAVDAVLLTHMHPDHAYGLLTAGGAAAFPNAEVVVAEPEFAFWSDDAMLARAPADAKPFFEGARAAVKPYAARLRRFSADGEVVPGIVAVAAPGHTPGHTMYRVVSGDAALLVWGDLVHSAALQLPRPEIAPSFDVDAARGIESRRRMLDEVANSRIMVAGMHIGFPGIGHVMREGQGYRLAPALWSSEL